MGPVSEALTHTIEEATSGRAKCRGCGRPIARGELRLGERLPNPYTEKEAGSPPMTLWFHLACGAYKRPEVWLAASAQHAGAVLDAEALSAQAQLGLAHPRATRIDGTERASSGRARCRHCREPITKGVMRIRLVYYEDGRFDPSGFIHVSCAGAYFGTADVLGRIRHFAPELSAEELADVERALAP